MRKHDNKNIKTFKRSYLYQKDRYIYNDLIRRSGAIVFSSSKGGQLSYESDIYKNGLFTEEIINSLTTTKADKNKDGMVSIEEMKNYITKRVPVTSNNLQQPTVDKDNIYQQFSFPIVR